jgi:phosphoribosylaminoimidazole-succinocarboxamide synthase
MATYEKGVQLYEGKAKKVYATNHPDVVIVSYKDDATAFNGLKKGSIQGKGAINNMVSNHVMQMLSSYGIPTHLVAQLSERETAVKKVSIVPLEVIIRNIAAGSMSKRYGVEEGLRLVEPVLEFSYKNDELGDPLINDDQAVGLGFATREDITAIRAMALHINQLMCDYFAKVGIILVDFKLEFGRTSQGDIVLADEISPDTCRFWDTKSGEKLDKDRFRRDLGGVEDAYREIFSRLFGEKD